MAVSKRTRYEVLRRDNHTCRYCGAAAPDAKLTVDHVTPVALGGSDDPSNLVAACRDCNYGKSSSAPDATLVADVKALDIKWAGAMARAAEILAQKRKDHDDYVLAFLKVWEGYGRTPDWDEWGITRLYQAGLPVDELVDVAEIAIFARGVLNRFSYFMGICWKRVEAMQETAKELLAAEEVDGDA